MGKWGQGKWGQGNGVGKWGQDPFFFCYTNAMARQPRIDRGGYVYHVINRAAGRVPIFNTESDFVQFEQTVEQAKELTGMRILAYCAMPNHFHFALFPENDGDLQRFMGWLTKTHTQRWHVAHNTIGHGPLYQGRYKSFIVDTDKYFLALMRYIEQNPLRARLVSAARDWRWGSLFRRTQGSVEQRQLLAEWPVEEPAEYRQDVERLLPRDTVDTIRVSVAKGQPFGGEAWKQAMIEKLNLVHTTRGVGRPRKAS